MTLGRPCLACHKVLGARCSSGHRLRDLQNVPLTRPVPPVRLRVDERAGDARCRWGSGGAAQIVLGRVGAVIGRIVITDVAPVVSCGRWPAKAVVGETVPVTATVFREGHDLIGADVVLIRPDGSVADLRRMRLVSPPGTDRYAADVLVDTEGVWSFHVQAWGAT